MISKADFTELETQIEPFVQQRKIKEPRCEALIDAYLSHLEQYFKQCNQLDDIELTELPEDMLTSLPVVPINFIERYQYILKRKYHFMGYQQMQTMKNELIKMNAGYQSRLKHQQKHTK